MVYNVTSYQTLGRLGMQGSGAIRAPVPAYTPSMAVQTVPVYSMPGYQALTHGESGDMSGYFNIQSAYGASDSCARATRRSCM